MMIDAAAEKLERLKSHRGKTEELSIADLFERDPDRFSGFSARCGDILFDYSKTAIDEEARKLLFDLANAAELPEKRDALFSGEHINVTEDRAVQHMALRNVSGDLVLVDGQRV